MRISPLALYAVSNILKVANSQDDFKGCAIPSFEWATFATRTTARTKGMRGAVSGGHIFAAGSVRSNLDAETSPEAGKIALTGPYSIDDPTGFDAETIEIDVASYPESVGYKENAGGSFGQYEIGVAKINAESGEPNDLFVYGGYGLDEISGLAAKDNAIAVSGHFTGNLTAVLIDGTAKTIWNSNIEEGGVPDQEDQFHPNNKDGSGHTGVDDGFVIKARAETGKADWIVRYPESNKDSQVVAVDIDGDGNVFGSGYKCSQAKDADAKVCDGIVAKMKSADGSVDWETTLPELGAAFHLKYDSEDESLYVTGTTTYGGSAKDGKDHSVCDHDTCAVVLRLSATDGSIQWQRTVKGSPRWGIVDSTGGVELANAGDGPFIYVAFDDVGEGDDTDISLDAGTPYAGCKSNDGITHEYDVIRSRVMIASDCPIGSTFFPRSDSQAVPASEANTGAHCGDDTKADACLIKYHKHTGLPKWGADVPSVAGLVPSSDGASVHIAGYYSTSKGNNLFDSVVLPGYLATGGLGTQTGGLFNAKLSSSTGEGEYVLHSGGGSWDRLYDMVGDSEGNIYNIGFSGNLVMNWGGSLKTTMAEDGVGQANVLPGTGAIERHMYISKLAAGTETPPSCVTKCDGNIDNADVSVDSCFIDGQCYMAGESGAFFGKSCWICDPAKDQRKWVQGPTIGTTQCYIDGLCLNDGDPFFYQRRSWSEKIFSECQVCDPLKDTTDWTQKTGYVVDSQSNPPEDCTVDDKEGNGGGGGGGDGDGSGSVGGGNGRGCSGGGSGSGGGGDGEVKDKDLDMEPDTNTASVLGGAIPGIVWLMCLVFVVHVH